MDILFLVEIPDYEKYEMEADANTSKMNITSVSCDVNKKLLAGEINQNSFKVESKELEESIASSSSNDHLLTVKCIKSNKNNIEDTYSKKNCQKKAKLLRLERKQNKLLAQGKSNSEIEALLSERKQHQNCSKSLEDFFSELSSEMNKLEVKYFTFIKHICRLDIVILI